MSLAKKKAPPPAATVGMPDGLEVWLDDVTLGDVTHLGRLHRVGRDTVRFEYSRQWLKHPQAFSLDPQLVLAEGNFYPTESNFGVFMDSCPDRWGQVLMKRREQVEAKQQARSPRNLTTWEYFLGVQDITRMGALRFSPLQGNVSLKKGEAPVFNAADCLANETLSAPAITRIGELQQVAYELTRKKVDDMALLQRWLRVLVAPGASLGGARPKANLQDGQGNLCIAKFPAHGDDHDWALREMLMHELAREFGLAVSPAHLERIGTGYHTFVTLRFDRAGGRRRFFISAMAMLDRAESEGASYLDLAEVIATRGDPAHIVDDLREIFRRVLFNVATANRDDHLRNHGFLWTPKGLRPAPAYDMNPSTKKDEHVLMLDAESAIPDLDTVMATAEFYQVTPPQAQEDLSKLNSVMGTWQVKGKQMKLSAEDILEMSNCFMV